MEPSHLQELFPLLKPETYGAGKPFHPISDINYKFPATKSFEKTLKRRNYTILTAILIDNNFLTSHQLITTCTQQIGLQFCKDGENRDAEIVLSQ